MSLRGASHDEFLRRVAELGDESTLAQLLDDGSCAVIRSLPNAETFPAMATLETGAWPAQHGIVGNVYHQAGDPLSRPTYAYSDGTFTSETLWEAAMRQGKHAIRLGTLFPRSAGSSDAGGADPTISSGGAGTVRSLPQPEAVGPGGIVSLEVESESTTWTRADPVQDALEVNRLTTPSGGQTLKLSGRADERITLELRVFAAGPAGSDPGFDRLLLDDDEDFDNGIRAEVRPGEWATVVVDPAPPAIATRVKLLDLDAQSGRARLYVRPMYRNRGSPADFIADLEMALGPAPGAPNFTYFDRGEIDSGTVREEIEREVEYLIDAAAYAIDHLDFDLLMMDGAVFDRVDIHSMSSIHVRRVGMARLRRVRKTIGAGAIAWPMPLSIRSWSSWVRRLALRWS